MTNELAMVFPMLPGKRAALEQFAAALNGPRRAEYVASQISVLKESWFVQSTPNGDLILVYFEAPDPTTVLARLAVSDEPFDMWFREQVQNVSGVDLTQPLGPLPECVFSWKCE